MQSNVNGVKAWSTRLARGEAHLQIEINRLSLDYANETRRLRSVLAFMQGGTHHCHCPLHLALDFSMNPGLIRAELSMRKARLDRQIRELKRAWHRKQHEAAIARARGADPAGSPIGINDHRYNN